MPEHFVWKVAHYVFCNWVRKKARTPRTESMESVHLLAYDRDDFETYAQNEEQKSRIARMREEIAALSARQRRVLVLHHLDGMSVNRIAAYPVDVL